MKFYKKPHDDLVLSEINDVLKHRPSYGYKRVTSIINRSRNLKSLKRYNKKRILRVMQMHGLVMSKAKITRDHVPTGKVMTLHSNTRWCSDCFEIKCFNGEKVYVAFILDTHDRELIGHIKKQEPIQKKDIQELMLQSVERRFNQSKTPREIQFLTDRGSIYRSPDTVQFARSLGLRSCFTMAYSPESNGMAESLVKTIKRDYVYTSDCYSADVVLKMLPEWIKDYNEIAPHSSLGMLSPMEYIQKIN